jgi:hypothetical protein
MKTVPTRPGEPPARPTPGIDYVALCCLSEGEQVGEAGPSETFPSRLRSTARRRQVPAIRSRSRAVDAEPTAGNRKESS